MKRSVKVWLIILLAVVIVFDIKAYFLLVNKFARINRELQESRVELNREQKVRRWVENELQITSGQLQNVKAELKSTQRQLKIVNSKLNGVEKNNLILQEEKAALEGRLHSLKELKKAIRQVKMEHRQQRIQEYLAGRERQKEIDAQKLTQGNRGFLVKDGQPVCQPKVKIEVNPT